MDLQRSLLIGAIAVLGFMLLTEWVQFKDARNTNDAIASFQQASAAPIVSTDTDFPTAASTNDKGNDNANIPFFDGSANKIYRGQY